MNLADFDFIDFGSSKGGSIDFAIRSLGGTRGFGIDLDKANVERMQAEGYECIQGDITRLELPRNSVRFVVMSHILEHLRSLEDVYRALYTARELATDFLFIQGPFFDADEYLLDLGFKLYWSDWHGHPCHLKTSELDLLLRRLDLDAHKMLVKDLIADSSHPAVHPLESPPDQHDFDPATHPTKATIPFGRPVWREMICCVPLRRLEDWDKIVMAKKGAEPWRNGR